MDEMMIQALAAGAVGTALNAAAAWAAANDKVDILSVRGDAFLRSIRREIDDTIPGALHDAKMALDAGMTKLVSLTFDASMALAGIRAAQRTADVVTSLAQ